MKQLKKHLLIGLVMLCMMLLGTACGGKKDAKETQAPDTTVAADSQADDNDDVDAEETDEDRDDEDEESDSEETTEAGSADSGDMIGRVMMPTTQVLNLRGAASSDGQVLIRLAPRDLLRVLAEEGDWYKVDAYHSGKHYEGYASKEYVSPCSTGKISADTAIYEKSKSSDNKLADLTTGSVVHIFNMKNDRYQVVADQDGKEYIGYVDTSAITPDGEVEIGKEIYLTFDDGPGQYTEKLLKVLAKYDVKVTFFVTNQYPDYINLIKDEAEAGHAVVVHTYSHAYEKIYKSEDAYFADFDKMADLIESLTGTRPTIFRFPGGSSNTISANYCQGIMTKLTEAAGTRGLVYSDWNVSSGDAGDTTSTKQVYKNVITEIEQNGRIPSVVLQHDIKGFSVDAVEDIIKWGLDNGYTFKAMTETEGIVHMPVFN